jgi:CMP-N-acetylneuraminic acid synthetase
MIYWTLMAAVEADVFHHIVVNTDDDEIEEYIKGVARVYGHRNVDTYRRPAALGGSGVGMAEVVLDFAVSTPMVAGDIIVTLLPTSPHRRVEDIRKAVELLQTQKADAAITGALAHPVEWTTTMREVGETLYWDWDEDPEVRYWQRQQCETRYFFVGAIFAQTVFHLLQYKSIHGGISEAMIEIPSEYAVQVDIPDDIPIIEALMERARDRKGQEARAAKNGRGVVPARPD